jgi:aspartate racemase
MSALLGILGGMGPLATVDFMHKLIAATPAAGDADHVPVVAWSVPQIPDRPGFILHGGESPLPAMLNGIRVLRGAGATCIAIPSNTAHYWYDELAQAAGVPILHIADAACDMLERRGIRGEAVGLMATRGTLAAGFYQRRLAHRGYRVLVNTETDQRQLVLPGIAAVKRLQLGEAAGLLRQAAARLRDAGARAIVLGCTEIPVALDHAGADAMTLDATQALAQACVRWWRMANPAPATNSATT